MKLSFRSLSVLILLSTAGCGETPTSTINQSVVDPAAAAGIQLGVIISPDASTESTYFVSKDVDVLNGLQALQETDVPLVSMDSTVDTTVYSAICKIGDTGYPADNCFGGTDPSIPSWAFFYRNPGGRWTYSAIAVNAYEVKDGDLLGFVFTPYSGTDFSPLRTPPETTLAQIAGQ
jgi:hypothetical protein